MAENLLMPLCALSVYPSLLTRSGRTRLWFGYREHGLWAKATG